jgi:hypothetical protein
MAYSCATCSFSRVANGQATFSPATNTVIKGPVRTCHAGPPQLLPVGNAAWPAVDDDDWCGQFKAVAAP